MTIKSVCPHFRASYDVSGDEFPDVGAPPSHLLHWQGTFFFIPGEGLLLSAQFPDWCSSPCMFLPLFNNRSCSHCTLLTSWAVSEVILQCRSKTFSQPGMCWPREGAPSQTNPGWPLSFGNVTAPVNCKTIDSRQACLPRAYESCGLIGVLCF